MTGLSWAELVLTWLAGAKSVTIFNVSPAVSLLTCLAGAKSVTIFDVSPAVSLLSNQSIGGEWGH